MADYNPFSLVGKYIFVTGASSGIGQAVAVECSKLGASVIMTARNEERLMSTLRLMDAGNHKIIIADLSNRNAILSIVDSIQPKLNGIVHCAGFTIPKLFQFVSEEEGDSIMSVNFKAPVLLCKELLKQKKISKSASIVFISSISGVFCSYVAGSYYSASKGAINGLAKGLAIELASKGIRVNCVNPGMIETGILNNSVISEEELRADAQKYPLKRYGKPDEVAHAVIYLLSDTSRWVTGTNLLIDGGYTLL